MNSLPLFNGWGWDFFSSGKVNQISFLLANCKLFVAGTVHMLPSHFRAPNTVLQYKKCFEMPALCYMVYNPDSVRPLGKLIYKVPFIEKCLSPMCYLLRTLKHILTMWVVLRCKDVRGDPEILKSSIGHLTPGCIWEGEIMSTGTGQTEVLFTSMRFCTNSPPGSPPLVLSRGSSMSVMSGTEARQKRLDTSLSEWGGQSPT